MRIEITGLKTRELLLVIRQNPKGEIEAERDRAYWNFELESLPTSPQPQQHPIQKPTQQLTNAVGGMKNYLFDAFAV